MEEKEEVKTKGINQYKHLKSKDGTIAHVFDN